MYTQALLDEIAAGNGLPLSQLSKLIPPTRGKGRPVSFSCVLRWVLEGALGPDGKERIALEAVRMAGRWVSSKAALQRWLAAQTPQPKGEPAPTPRSASKRQRSSDRAAKQLTKLGI